MKKISLLILILLTAAAVNARDKYYASFEFHGKKYKCELIYERTELIPTYTLHIQSIDLKTNVVKKSDLIIKKQEYVRDLRTNIETWERFQKRRNSYRVPKEITFHIVDEKKSYATYVFERSYLKEIYFNEELCLDNEREKRIFVYPKASIIFAVVEQFLKSTFCLPNEYVISQTN